MKMFTDDIKAEWGDWLNIVRMLQAEGNKQDGLAVAKFFVVLNKDGTPAFWTAPHVTLLEPKNRLDGEALATLLNMLG